MPIKFDVKDLTKQDILFFATFLFFVAYAWYLHVKASFFFPVPWDDEEFFLWQSLAFQKSNTLFQAVLNPDRLLIYKPPAYLILMGLLFKVFGFTFQLARDFSFILIIAGFGFLAALIKPLRLNILCLALSGLFLINRYFVVIGNLARMEALNFVMVTASFFLITKRHYWKALALLLFSVLVHPNGAYFLLTGGVLVAIRIYMDQEKIVFRRSDLLIWLAVLAAFLAYAIFCAIHWASFQHDMGDQFAMKLLSHRNLFGFLINPIDTSFFILAFVFFIIILKKDPRFIHFPILAAGSRLVHAIGQEFFYEFFTGFAYLCLSLSIIHGTCLLLETMPQKFADKSRLILKTSVITLMLLLNFSMRMLDYPILGKEGHNWSGMRMPDKSYAPYLPSEDKKRVIDFLKNLAKSEGPISVEFRPFADSLFFENMRSNLIKIYQPYYYTGKPKTPYVQVHHYNEHLPPGNINSLLGMFRTELSKGRGEILLQFSSREQHWYVVIYRNPDDLPS